jgi:signal transduction histidine kinase
MLLAVALLLYFQSLVRRVDSQTEAMSDLVAHAIAVTTLAVEEEPDSTAVDQFTRLLRSLNFPVILTDVNGLPLVWNRHVEADTLSIDRLLEEDLARPSPSLRKVLEIQARMDEDHPPVGMFRPGSGEPLLYLHYGSPPLAAELRWTPWITILAAALFGVVGLLMLRSIRRAETGFIWAGMAKETAHQMGTPLSSLIGWMEVLRDEVSIQETHATLPRELYEEALHEIERDTGRLNRVAARFSQIGSRPKLEPAEVGPVVSTTVDYFRSRFPKGVGLTLEVDPATPSARLNAELMGWVVENLLKNAMNAVEPGGKVAVKVEAGEGQGQGAVIRVRDDGRGIEPGMEEQIFRPGVSTRRRGWGLGLPLSRRIVEEYHGGRLDLAWTQPGRGTEFRVVLPLAEKPVS